MFVNFLWQIFLFFMFIVIIHSLWSYVKENVLSKNDKVSHKQIEKYEKIIEELQQNTSNEPLALPSTDNTDIPPEKELEDYLDSIL